MVSDMVGGGARLMTTTTTGMSNCRGSGDLGRPGAVMLTLRAPRGCEVSFGYGALWAWAWVLRDKLRPGGWG